MRPYNSQIELSSTFYLLPSVLSMAYQFYWPSKYYFYPFGNTSAVSLTRDLPPREPAALLLLGCGDPRNVLYTIFCESKGACLPTISCKVAEAKHSCA